LDSIYAGLTHVKLNRQTPEIWHALSQVAQNNSEIWTHIFYIRSLIWANKIWKLITSTSPAQWWNKIDHMNIFKFWTGLPGVPFKICQFWLSTYAPVFFFESLPTKKNIALEQNCLSAMKIEFINHIFPSKGDYLIYRPPLTLFSYKLKLHV
jgi:hypothetical protein